MPLQDGDDTSYKAAIAGLACRLPMSHNIQEFWEKLIAGVDMIGPTRWPEGLYGLPPRAGFIPYINKFDSKFFDFSDLEVNNMNPILLHLLEVTYECIVDSGLQLQDLQTASTGFYLACFLSDFDAVETSRGATSGRLSITSCLAGCVTQWFGLRGPMVTVDTACSSSVSALHMAVIDLLIGKCKYAIVAGVNLILNPVFVQQMLFLNMLSPEGRSRVFDKEANGYVRAEGIATILLARSPDHCKRLYASIVNVGVNCDGYISEGITFPNREAQSDLLRTLYDESGLTGDDLAYLEGHSTSTQAGDRTEVAALEVLYGCRKKPLLMGAVKSNIGHTEATAGLAGILKCILIAHHQVIPPNLNFKKANPRIDALVSGKIKVVDRATPLPDGCIGVNSFGFGGVNGHVILQPFYRKSVKKDNYPVLIPLKLRSFEAIVPIQKFILEHKEETDLLHMMSQSMVSHDAMQPLRGYVMTNGAAVDDCVRTGYPPDCVRTGYPPDCVRTGYPPEDMEIELPLSIWLVVDELFLDHVTVAPNLLKNKCFLTSLEMSQKILSSLDSEIVLQKIIENRSDIMIGSINGICVGIAVLLGLVDCIMATGLQVRGVVGSGLSEIVAAYLDFCLDRKQCIQIAHAIGRTMCETNYEKKFQVYHVNLQSDQAFRLGPKVQILAILSFERFVIAVPKDYREKVLRNIHRKGGHYRLLAADFLMYSSSSFNLEKLTPELEQIIPSPKAWSVRMLRGKAGLLYPDGKADAAFISDLLNTRVDMTTALQIISLKSYLVHVTLAPHFAADVPRSPLNYCWKSVTNLHEHSLFCRASLESLYQTLGEIHLLGHSIDQSSFFDIEYPLGCEATSLSPLVFWDHTVDWHMPQWPEFSCRVKDDMIRPYTIFHCELEGIHTPIAPLIYHTWTAICQRLQPSEDMAFIPIILSDIATHTEDLMECGKLTGAVIQVHTSSKQFTVAKEGVVLLSGKFLELENGVDLPSVPGYDLDINQNAEPVNELCDSIIEKTEIMWEDSWLDFLNSVLEFASQFVDGRISQIRIDPKRHAEDVKDCANILTVMELHTGLCKAGSVVCQFHNTCMLPSAESFSQKSNVSKMHGGTMVSTVMVYSFHGDEADTEKLLVYRGHNPVIQKRVIGLVLMKGQKFTSTEVALEERCEEELEMVVPYLISVYILHDIAKVTAGDKLFMLPPLDSVAVYILALAEQCDCRVFTSSWDIEIHQMVESVFPSIHCLPGKNWMSSISSLTQGDMCDSCIRLTGGDLSDTVDLVSQHGLIIQCIPPPQDKAVGMDIILQNKMVTLLEPAHAIQEFFNKSAEDQKALLCGMTCDSIIKLLEEGFPESSGILYRRDEKVDFHSIKLQMLLNLLDEPGLNVSNLYAGIEELDASSVKQLQNIISDKPKDYSIAELEVADSYYSEIQSVNNLNMAMALTPSTTWNSFRMLEFQTPERYVSTIAECSSLGNNSEQKALDNTLSQNLKIDNKGFAMHPSSTPVITITLTDDNPDGSRGGENQLSKREKLAKSRDETDSGKRIKKILSNINVSSPTRVDLVLFGPPPTPLTPQLKEMLTPNFAEPNIISLNGVAENETERPLFIVHPISGNLLLLENLGKLIHTQCFGIKKTAVTPKDSIKSIASYYINGMERFQARGPYRIAGYSYGSTIALEMVLQLQASKKEVECLICLDGSLDYFYHQIAQGKEMAPPGTSQKQLESYIEVGSLLEFMSMYKPVHDKALLHSVLLTLPTLEAQIQMAVDITTGHVILNAHQTKSHWQFLKEKVRDKLIIKSEQKPKLFGTAVEVIRLKRKEKAEDFVNSIRIVNNYHPSSEGKKFIGDIHLLRIKSELPHCKILPTDYGLHDLCTGQVYVKFYTGDHQSFINLDDVQMVANDINQILAPLSAG